MSLKNILANVNLKNVSRGYAWYPVTTLFNNEESYISNVKSSVQGTKLEPYIEGYYVPIKYIGETRKDKHDKEVRKIRKVLGAYSRYVFVKCIMTSEIWTLLRTTPGCAVVLAAGGFPIAISDEEMEKIQKVQSPEGLTPKELLELGKNVGFDMRKVKKPLVTDEDFNTDFT